MECTVSRSVSPAGSMSSDLEAGTPPVIHRLVCDDVDALAGSIRGCSVQLDQLAPGPFRGTVDQIRLGDMDILRERVNRALLKRGTMSTLTTSFSIPLETTGSGYCGGIPLIERTLLVSCGTSLPELRTPDQHDIAVLTVPTPALSKVASQHEGELPQSLSDQASVVRLAEDHYRALRTFLLTSFNEACDGSPTFSSAQACKALHDALLLELARLMEVAASPVRLTQTDRRRVVDRVREFVTSRPDEPVTVLDVCHAVGTSRRKLQYCFEEVLGTHPAYYLRVIRLNGVRRELRHHSPLTASVGDVAHRWGFWHLSRFANHYRHLFGELPSDTLKRPPR